MPPIPSTPNDNNENEKKKNVGDAMRNAVLERNTHTSNRATVSAGTGTVITMEVASGPKVDTYPVRDTRITTEPPHRSRNDQRKTTDRSCPFPSHALTPGPRRPLRTCS